MEQKDKNIRTLANDIDYIANNIEKAKAISSCRATIIIEEVGDIIVWQHLADPLQEFLVQYFENQKKEVYKKLKIEIESNEQIKY